MPISTMAPAAFTITQAGIDAAVAAGAMGATISINKFRLGTGFGYVPSLSETNLHGAVVFQATPKAWNMISDNSRDVVCVVPATAGPFAYGEIGLFLEDGTLFALAAYGELQLKSSAAAGIANSLTFHCVLNVGMSPALIQIVTDTAGVLAQIGSTKFVTGPSLLPGKPNGVIVAEVVNGANSILMSQANDLQWTVCDYMQIMSGTVTAISADGLTVTSAAFNYLTLESVTGDFLMQDMKGNVRVVNYGQPGVAILTYPVSGLSVGDTVMGLSRQLNLYDLAEIEALIHRNDAALTSAMNAIVNKVTVWIGTINLSIDELRALIIALTIVVANHEIEDYAEHARMQAEINALKVLLAAQEAALAAHEVEDYAEHARLEALINANIAALAAHVLHDEAEIARLDARIDALTAAVAAHEVEDYAEHAALWAAIHALQTHTHVATTTTPAPGTTTTPAPGTTTTPAPGTTTTPAPSSGYVVAGYVDTGYVV